jgi:predicted hydrocarbon binding protein/predicted transcriptional regulator
MGNPHRHNTQPFGSFAEAVSTLEKLTKIETKVAMGIDKSLIPWKESRKLLKCMTPDQVSNTSLFQFMQDLFTQIGLGKLEITNVERFKLIFQLSDCQVCKIYKAKTGSKVCFIASDALLKFFVKGMDLPCSVEETKCIKEGKEVCEFKVDLQPLGVYKIALDDTDRALIEQILSNRFKLSGFAEEHCMEDGQVEYRLRVLQGYNIVDPENNVTEIGSTYFKFAQGLSSLEEDFDPPWKTLSDITQAIASKSSFAEALSETSDTEPFIEVDQKEIVNLAEEAKKSRSFAELISKYVKNNE